MLLSCQPAVKILKIRICLFLTSIMEIDRIEIIFDSIERVKAEISLAVD